MPYLSFQALIIDGRRNVDCHVVNWCAKHRLEYEPPDPTLLEPLARKREVESNRSCAGDTTTLMIGDGHVATESDLRWNRVALPCEPQRNFRLADQRDTIS